MPIIKSGHPVHDATCVGSENTRQNAVAAAIAAGGGSATVAAAVKAADVAFYRSVIASCKANGLPFNNFSHALWDLGTGGQ
jgi:hypothetical protein